MMIGVIDLVLYIVDEIFEQVNVVLDVEVMLLLMSSMLMKRISDTDPLMIVSEEIIVVIVDVVFYIETGAVETFAIVESEIDFVSQLCVGVLEVETDSVAEFQVDILLIEDVGEMYVIYIGSLKVGYCYFSVFLFGVVLYLYLKEYCCLEALGYCLEIDIVELRNQNCCWEI